MTIYETVRADITTARKARDSGRVTILSTILGEMSSKATVVNDAKIVSDADAIAVLKKSIKGLDEMITLAADKSSYENEKTILETYLPKQLSEEEIRKEIRMLIIANDGNINFGSVMTYLKENFSGQYDGKIASQIAKELIVS